MECAPATKRPSKRESREASARYRSSNPPSISATPSSLPRPPGRHRRIPDIAADGRAGAVP